MNDNGYYTREELLDFGFKTVGENVLISRKACIYGAENMSFGSNVRIDDFCMLVGTITMGSYIHIAPFVGLHGSGGGEIVMEDFSTISSQSSVYAGSDDYGGEVMTNSMVPERYKRIIKSKIVFGRHSILGLNCVVLPGAAIAEGAAVGAMSLVNKPLEEWSVYIGIPCKKTRDRSRELLKLEKEFLEELKLKSENRN